MTRWQRGGKPTGRPKPPPPSGRGPVQIRSGPAPVIKDESKPWYKIQNIGGNSADVWIYDEIGGWGITAQNLVSELSVLNVAEITVHLNSPGGDVFDGIAIMNSLRDHPANVVIKVDALAASIASVIAQAGNKIIMGRNSTMMIHNASGFAMGEAEDLIKMAELLTATTENIASIYAERAGGTKGQWLKVMAVETWYTADEAVAAGLADEVAPLPTEREAHQQAAKWDLSNYAHAPKIEPLSVVPIVGETGCALVIPEAVLDTEGIAWDPVAFRTSLTAAIPEPITWDPSLVRAAISLVTNDVPVPEPRTPEPAPVSVWNPELIAGAIRKARAT